MSYHLYKFLKLCVSQTKKNSLNTCFLRLTFLLTSLFCSICSQFNRFSSRSSSKFKEFSLGCILVGSSRKKKKIGRYNHSLSFVVTRCITRCHSMYHSLPFVVTRCHSLPIVVPLVVTRCITRLSFYKPSP